MPIALADMMRDASLLSGLSCKARIEIAVANVPNPSRSRSVPIANVAYFSNLRYGI